VANFSTIATGVNDAGGKLPPVSTTPAANFPLVLLTPVANNGNNIRLQKSEAWGKLIQEKNQKQKIS
jgi:hypothetical protein